MFTLKRLEQLPNDEIVKIENLIKILSADHQVKRIGSYYVEPEGRLSKRIKKAVQYNIPNDWINAIVQPLSYLGMNWEDFTIEKDSVSESFRWYPGKYGDSGSCYWESKSISKKAVQLENGCTFRMYKEGSDYGRFIGIPYCSGWILFNLYTRTNSIQPESLFKCIAESNGLKYQHISFTLSDAWINANTGYYIGSSVLTDTIVRLYPDVRDYNCTCDGCKLEYPDSWINGIGLCPLCDSLEVYNYQTECNHCHYDYFSGVPDDYFPQDTEYCPHCGEYYGSEPEE